MTEIVLPFGQAQPDQYEAFEVELGHYNLKPRIKTAYARSDFLTIIINTSNEDEEDLVKELASLCLSPAPIV